MATRSDVYIQRADGSLHGCYVHWDGYPRHRGLLCLAHAEAGTFEDFIKEKCEEDGHEYDWESEDTMLGALKDSDRSWVYVLRNDGNWSVWQRTDSDGEYSFKHHDDLWRLVADEMGVSVEDLHELVSAKAKTYKREYGKDTSKPYAIHFAKLTFEDNSPHVKEKTVPLSSFKDMCSYFDEIQNHVRKQGYSIVSQEKAQLVTKYGKCVIVVTKI